MEPICRNSKFRLFLQAKEAEARGKVAELEKRIQEQLKTVSSLHAQVIFSAVLTSKRGF